ncbi:MAG: SulP family inorganic anion transporter [Lachnospiraceae bacterium]|nr:SulP family inorganic anion transporter [Lachnospiraceae bacterium]MDY5496507.1 SulP family inorganic anion transporter [Anaerobutyricum sp.]
MGFSLFPTLKGYKKEYLGKDILAGIMIAAVSIPISMGYAEVSGLPAVYGLYGSVLPILFFALFSTSPQFIFGVDAAPAAIAGAALTSLGIAGGSPDAVRYVPVISLFAGLWLLFFYFLKAGKLVTFISTPVMGGFISGISLTIILMQIPKILGGRSGSGELPELVKHIWETGRSINWLSVALGVGALAILIVSKKYMPKFPMAVIIMAAGMLATIVFHVDDYGVTLLSKVEPGLPKLILPDLLHVNYQHVAGRGLMIAVVIMAETLLSENNFASKNGYKIDVNREILACAAGNLSSAFIGSCPTNGSISRTSMNEQFGGKTQVVSVTAAISMVAVLLFATGFIGYLPVPVLTAIVISALLNVVEWHLAVRLFRVSRKEFYIFVAACLSVLFLGTIYGVLIGILLSFVAVVMKETNPPRTFLGMIPGREGFYDLGKNHYAHPVKNTVIYRFNASLFFANSRIFQEDIENNIKEDTKTVIVDAGTITNIDITAADTLVMLKNSLEKKGISFYLTEHVDTLNTQIRNLGIGNLIEEGCVRRTITAALLDSGLTRPFSLEEVPDELLLAIERKETAKKRIAPWLPTLPAEEENTLEEFTWAFGEDAVTMIEKKVHEVISGLHHWPEIKELSESGFSSKMHAWRNLGAIDEDELLRRMEMHLDEISANMEENHSKQLLFQLIEKRRYKLAEELRKENPEVWEKLEKRRENLEQQLEEQNPELVKKLHDLEHSIKSDVDSR